ncbi:DUF4157 domain-containing protein [Variovorax humicola]|uniref:DUF4157 domain-containing protein n=1 Tax=Variovorax humicola TaxID=1769758 RepID=A0ABU8VWY7_9BURK
MKAAAPLQARASRAVSNPAAASGLLQRQCACSPCSACSAKSSTDDLAQRKEREFLQAELVIGASNDPLEREADRVADQVLTGPAHAAAHGVAPRIQRATAQASQESAAAVPASVHRSLASTGSPLEPALRRDMEDRFGHDFSEVRVHADAAAEQSTREVQAHAYTVGHDVVFGAGQYAPATSRGRHLIAHELTHVIQQTGAPVMRRKSATKATTPQQDEEDTTRTDHTAPCTGTGARRILQRDFALEPPRPRAEGKVLTAPEIAAAIAFNQRVVTVIGTAGVSELRDVLGIEPVPAVIDEDFVNAVVRWQAVQAIGQDGKLGPGTARRLFREIGAEGVGRGALVHGPAYHAVTSLTPPLVGGIRQATFNFDAEFADDPANGLFASCCEIRQFIQWDAAYAAAGPGGPPHAGFPAGTAANTWIEDRDAADTRYGHRTGPHSALGNGDEYLDNTAKRNAAFGNTYRGQDNPGSRRNAGHWRFMVRAFDVCNGNRRLGDDFLRVTW